MSWIYLILAIVFEVSGTTCMKVAEGFTRLLPSVLIFVFYGMSLTFLTLTLKKIEVSVAYAVWSALGTALIALIGIMWFRETLNLLKVASLALIILGVVGLHLSQGQDMRTAPEAGMGISETTSKGHNAL
jgi:small multidrug resistance pump